MKLRRFITKELVSTFGRFLVVGFSSMLVNLFWLWLLTTADVPQFLAAILATEISIINNFFWNERWTFKFHSKQIQGLLMARFVRFQIVASLTSCLTLGMFLFFTRNLHIYYILAQAWAIAITTIVNFSVNSCFTWRVFRTSRVALTELGKPILEASVTMPGAIDIKMEME